MLPSLVIKIWYRRITLELYYDLNVIRVSLEKESVTLKWKNDLKKFK